MLEISDSQAVESELDMLGSNNVVKLFDVLMQGSILSREVSVMDRECKQGD